VLAWTVLLGGLALWVVSLVFIVLGEIGLDAAWVLRLASSLAIGAYAICRGAAWLRAEHAGCH